MNLRLDSKGIRIRISEAESNLLQKEKQWEERLCFPGSALLFRIVLLGEVAGTPGITLRWGSAGELICEITELAFQKLLNSNNSEIKEKEIQFEIDRFSKKRGGTHSRA